MFEKTRIFLASFKKSVWFHGRLNTARGKLLAIRTALICRIRQRRVLSRIRSRDPNEKVRVLFLCSNTAKWKCQTVYEKMEASGLFEPIVGITALGEMAVRPDEELEAAFTDAEKFFAGLGDRCVRVCTLFPRRYDNLRRFAPDIIFFPEPWILRHPQTTREVSKFALPCYVPYFVVAHLIPDKQCRTPMHRHLFDYFVQNESLARLYEHAVPWFVRSYHAIPTGHPALDFLSRNNRASSDGGQDGEGPIIYAPHHSVTIGNARHPEWSIGTFLETGKPMLDYAEKHPEAKWVFKPHPQLRRALLQTGSWTDADIDAYFDAWKRIGTVCTDGNYQDLFLSSKAMVTDSASFLLEYGATGKPLVQLVPPGAGTGLSPHIRDLLASYYRVENVDELTSTLDLLIVKGEDAKRPQRLAALRKAGLLGVDAAQNIVDYLRKLLKR